MASMASRRNWRALQPARGSADARGKAGLSWRETTRASLHRPAAAAGPHRGPPSFAANRAARGTPHPLQRAPGLVSGLVIVARRPTVRRGVTGPAEAHGD